MILIFDIGKTNKKCLVFDEDYRVVFEKTDQLPETTDEDGDACEDLELLKKWVLESLDQVLADERFNIKAINAATYGASFVHLDADGNPLTPLYNYLKPFPDDLRKQFFDTYGHESKMALETASPVLGHLNSGLQLYWLKHRKPLIFNQIKYSLHLPQYISYLIKCRGDLKSPRHLIASEITSIGCHTMLWDFQKNDYHDWVKAEGVDKKFPPILPWNAVTPNAVPGSMEQYSGMHIGIGLHDSSAALIPYLACFKEPFLLISTGTWCISMNPFNDAPLTAEELEKDCLCYLTYEGKPVKAARYFGGHEHEQVVKNLEIEFGVPEDSYRAQLPESLKLSGSYTGSMRQIVEKQAISTQLALGNSSVQRIFVDGGFSRNQLYMTYLAEAFPKMEVYAAEVAQATALGAAMAIHNSWNSRPLQQDLITLKKYEPIAPIPSSTRLRKKATAGKP